MSGPEADRPTDVIAVAGLNLSYRIDDKWLKALVDVSLRIRRGEIFGLVGESGSGKTTLALQLLGYRAASSGRLTGQVLFDDLDLTSLPPAALERLRGRRISYVPQNPTTSLNPGRRIGDLVEEVLLAHVAAADPAAARRRCLDLLASVGLPTPETTMARYPHQLSGGQQQRVVIAMALACEPDLIVLDEPTTGLDVTTQQQILRLLSELRARLGTAMLYVTHDLGVIEALADRVGVMYAGSLVEIGSTADIFRNPRHPYTTGLIASVPRLGVPLDPARMLRGSLNRAVIGDGCPFQPRCPRADAICVERRPVLEDIGGSHILACHKWNDIAGVVNSVASRPAPRHIDAGTASLLRLEDVSIRYGAGGGLLGKLLGPKGAATVSGVSFSVTRGEVFALVGESGSGKSTIARAISGLLPIQGGSLVFDGAALPQIGQRNRLLKRRIQFVFQNPDASLNPRRTVGDTLARPLALFHQIFGDAAKARVARVLEEVQLPRAYSGKFADELSGGERQRVAIARALLAEPDLILCDEVLSALDVSVQASILELLKRLRRETGIAMIFISHDLAVVEQIADRVGVLHGGKLLECGPVAEFFAPPHHPYTKSLLDAVPAAGAQL